MSQYQQQLQFAKSLGFKNTALAIGSLGARNFKLKFQKFSPTTIEKISAAPVTKIKPKAIETSLALNAVQLRGINNNYWLYKDGRVWSQFQGGTFIKAYQYKGASSRLTPHYAVGLRTNGETKVYQMSRLMMFYFGVHTYKTIEEMPIITYINGNTKDWALDNLRFAKKGEIIKKATSKKQPDTLSKIKDTELQRVKDLLSINMSLAEIAEIYSCSDMSVHRYIKRHNL